MEALGEILKRTREQKGYTFDQVSRDTNIARRFLEALEAEDFSQFPGEPYLLGFLRNYADYLGLNSQDLVSAYRTIKIQEQPIPVEQLLHSKPSFPVLPALAVIVGLALVGLIAFWVLKPSGAQPETVLEPLRQAVQYDLTSGQLEQRLYVKDRVVVSIGTDKYILTLAALGRDVTMTTPGGDIILELGQDAPLDLNGDGMKDASLFIADLFKNSPDKGVMVRLALVPPEVVTAAAVSTSGAAVESAPNPMPSTTGGIAAPVILTSPNAYPFTMQATFKGYCMFRWESDRNDREERYFHKAEILNVQAQSSLRMWISNAGAAKLVVIGGGKTVNLELGSSGEVVVVDLKWIKDEEGRFVLTTIRLD